MKNKVWQKLRQVIDPELKVDIVSLGLIYEVKLKKITKIRWKVKVIMTLTTPGCPLAGVIDTMIKESIAELEEIVKQDVETELVWDPPWISDMMSEEAKLKLGFL